MHERDTAGADSGASPGRRGPGGIVVVSLNMAGSVPDEADLVVTDPVQAGVMTVMLVVRTATFDIRRQRGRRY